MYPGRFDYAAPDSLDEALSLLKQHGDDAKLLAGGQSLIPLLKLRFADPGILVDINRVPGLNSVEEKKGQLRIGALARHNELVASDVLRKASPTNSSL